MSQEPSVDVAKQRGEEARALRQQQARVLESNPQQSQVSASAHKPLLDPALDAALASGAGRRKRVQESEDELIAARLQRELEEEKAEVSPRLGSTLSDAAVS